MTGRIIPPEDEEAELDAAVLRAVFQSRIRLVKMTREEAVASAGGEWDGAQKWLKSESRKEGSFYWMCDYFDLEPTAVKRAIREQK